MKYIYVDGSLKAAAKPDVSSMMQAFNYGTAAFEGMKAFYLEDQKNWFIFRPDQYYARLRRSCKLLEIKLQLSQSEFVEAIGRLIRKNNIKTDLYIRPLVYRNAKGVGLMKPSGSGISMFVQQIPFKSANRYRCCFVSQRRPVDGSYSGKLTGNYLLSFFSYQEARRKKCDVGILLSSDGYLSEASIMNLFFVRGSGLYTPSLACGPLAGITRRTIIEAAQSQLGIKVREGKYRPASLFKADEIFFTGTGSGINYVRQIEQRKFNLNRNDQLAVAVSELYYDITHGRIAKYRKWLVPVG